MPKSLHNLINDVLLSPDPSGFESINIYMGPDGPFVSLRRKGGAAYACDQMKGGTPADHLINMLKTCWPQPRRALSDDDILGDL